MSAEPADSAGMTPEPETTPSIRIGAMNQANWTLFQSDCRARIDRADNTWFQVPYRSKVEGLALAFNEHAGPEWMVRYVPVRANIVLHGYLLTNSWTSARILTVFQTAPQRWYREPGEDSDQPQTGPRRSVRTRERKSMLRDVTQAAIFDQSLAGLIRRHGWRANGGNPQSGAYIPALFEVWLDENGITGADADAYRLLAGLGDFEAALKVIADHKV